MGGQGEMTEGYPGSAAGTANSTGKDGKSTYLVHETLTSVEHNKRIDEWATSNEAVGCDGPGWSVKKATLHGGRQEGVDLITVDNGVLTFTVVPTRGMSIRDVIANTSKGSLPLGWKSPVRENVHPMHVELNDRGGLGWLTGFNEWLVRCGVAHSGHPTTDGRDGHLLTLHGRIGNIPASEVEVIVESAPPHRIRVRGRVDECMFKFCDFELWTEVWTIPGSSKLHIRDTILNRSDYEREYQIIYHTNFGPGSEQSPLLEGGANFFAPVDVVAPFDKRATTEIDEWQTFRAPTRDYGETVYCVTTHADWSGRSCVALVNSKADKGVALKYKKDTLPYFTLWKNTDTLKEGYVTGLEPGTSFCYPKAVERAANRVPKLQPGAEASFELDWSVLMDKASIEAVIQEIEDIQDDKEVRENRTETFYAKWKRYDPRIPEEEEDEVNDEHEDVASPRSAFWRRTISSTDDLKRSVTEGKDMKFEGEGRNKSKIRAQFNRLISGGSAKSGDNIDSQQAHPSARATTE